MIYSIVHTVTCHQAVVANSATEALAEVNAKLHDFYLDGEASKKGIVMAGSHVPTTIHAIEGGKAVLVGYDANGEFVPVKSPDQE